MMDRRDGLDHERSDPQRLTWSNFHDIVAPPSEHRAEAGRRDDARSPSEPRERWQVKVVVVPVGDEDRVDPEVRDHLAQVPGMPMEWTEAVDEKWIGEDAHSVELQEHRGVPQKSDGRRGAHDRSLRVRPTPDRA